MNAKFVLLFGLLVFLQSPKLSSQDKSIDESIQLLGRIPVFYNGRISTHEDVATALLFRINEDSKDGENAAKLGEIQNRKSFSASLWLLDIMSGHKRFREYPIFKVSKTLTKLMKVESESNRVSFAQLALVRKTLVEAMNKPDNSTKTKLAIDGLEFERSHLAKVLQAMELVEEINFFHQTELEPNRMADLAISSMRFPIPLYAPPPGDGFEWETSVFADVFDQVKKTNRKDITLFKKILRSHRENNVKDFVASVKAYSSIVRQSDFESPLSFKVPEGWKEVNNPRGMNLDYFNDFNGFGIPIASFHCGPEFKCMGGLACVIEATGSMVRSVNNERYIAGLLPLPEKELEKKLEKIQIAGQTGYRFVHENKTPQAGGNKSIQIGFKIDNLTWAASIYGPEKSVDAEQKRFAEFSSSLKIDNSFFQKMMQRRIRSPNPNPSVLTIYVCSRNDQTLVLRLHEMRKRNPKNREAMVEALKSIPDSDKLAKSVQELEWKLPAGWKLDDNGMIVAKDFTAYVVCDLLEGQADAPTQERIADLLCGLGGQYVLEGKSEEVDTGERKTRLWKLKPVAR